MIDSSAGAAPRLKARPGALFKLLLGRLLHPAHLWRAIRLQRGRKARRTADDDSQLQLYHRILRTDFLHYGYFDRTDLDPNAISFDDLRHAQRRYAEVLLEHAVDRTRPVLDIGCGMGGLLGMLRERGFQPVALTPDASQIRYLSQRYADVPRIHAQIEALDATLHRARYGTVITSESLQYLELDRALPLLAEILAPAGRWIACDYFRTTTQGEKSGHDWQTFCTRVERDGWRFVMQRDITDHVTPALAFLHMWGAGVLAPAVDYQLQRIERRDPGIHYLIEPAARMLREVLAGNLQLVDPQHFAANKRYMLMVLQRS